MAKIFLPLLATAVFCAALFGCGKSDTASGVYAAGDVSGELIYDHSLDILYAENFCVDYYNGGFALITIHGDTQYLYVPEGQDVPSDLPDEIKVINAPLENVYMAASAVMDMFISIDEVECVGFSAYDADGWYLDEAREAMLSGNILYAGKYSAPDYELILSEGCGLAIENTNIFHNPEVKEELESFGITVLVDYSSYESEPAGRMEWVKLYGVLTGKEEAAEAVFSEQLSLLEREAESADADIPASEDEGDGDAKAASGEKSVTFFYITSAGAVSARKTTDYIAKMIELAGGSYVPDYTNEDSDSDSSTVTLQMEEFYAAAKDADYIIYNTSMGGSIESADDLVALDPILANFKAVQNGSIYCANKSMYQASMRLGSVTRDIRKLLDGDEDLTYFYKAE